MTDQESISTSTNYEPGARQRAIEAYEGARDRATNTLGEAPLLALAGGIAAGALIAALLPRTATETRAIRPTARRVRETAKAAFEAAKGTGTRRLDELGISRGKAENTVRSLFESLTDAAKASANSALDAARSRDKG